MSAVGAAKNIDYSKTPLPEPPLSKFSPQPPKPKITQKIKTIAQKMRRNSTPHPSAFKKYVVTAASPATSKK